MRIEEEESDKQRRRRPPDGLAAVKLSLGLTTTTLS